MGSGCARVKYPQKATQLLLHPHHLAECGTDFVFSQETKRNGDEIVIEPSKLPLRSRVADKLNPITLQSIDKGRRRSTAREIPVRTPRGLQRLIDLCLSLARKQA